MDQTTRPEAPAPGASGSGERPVSSAEGAGGEQESAITAMLVGVDRLDELGLEAVEPATIFGWGGQGGPG